MNEKQDKQITGSYLIALLAAVLNGEVPPPIPNELDWGRLYKLAAWHSVANMVYYGLSRLEPLPAPKEMKVFREARNKGIAKEARQELEVELILAELEEKHIKCMSLKGYIIKHFYPQPDMRLMADVDILVENSQLEKARDIMLSLSYSAERTGGDHDVYYKQPVMNIELHRRLIPEGTGYLSTYFANIWERARLTAGSSFRYEMSNEDFYIYLLAHMAKHYRGCGTGIRSVMDVWIYHQHYKDKLDWNYIDRELEKTGLYGFAQSMEGLSEQWFSRKVNNKVYVDLSAYILANGTYGNHKNAVLKSFIQGKKERDNFTLARVKYALLILFPDMNVMTILFPFLQKYPFFLPICWFLRGIRTVMFRRSNIRLHIDNISSINKSNLEQMMKIQQ